MRSFYTLSIWILLGTFAGYGLLTLVGLGDKNELFEIGIDYYLDQPGIHFVEWSKEFLKYLPKPDINISFLILQSSRLVTVEVNNEK